VKRLLYLAALVGAVALLSSAPLQAQAYGVYAPGLVTPEIHLGSADEPTVVKVPPVVVQQPGLAPYGAAPEEFQPEEQSAEPMPALAFDYLVSPTSEFFPGSIADNSVSLGEYARELRAHKGEGPPPVHLDINSLPQQ